MPDQPPPVCLRCGAILCPDATDPACPRCGLLIVPTAETHPPATPDAAESAPARGV